MLAGDIANHKAKEAETLSKSETGPAREQERQLSKKVIFKSSKKVLCRRTPWNDGHIPYTELSEMLVILRASCPILVEVLHNTLLAFRFWD